jgi:NADH dehydrogenase
VEDLATCLLAALREERTIGQTYELGGPAFWSYAQMVKLVLRLRGFRRIPLSVPRLLLVPSVVAMGLLFKDPPATLGELRQLGLDNIAALDSVFRHFGFAPEPLEAHLEYVRGL